MKSGGRKGGVKKSPFLSRFLHPGPPEGLQRGSRLLHPLPLSPQVPGAPGWRLRQEWGGGAGPRLMASGGPLRQPGGPNGGGAGRRRRRTRTRRRRRRKGAAAGRGRAAPRRDSAAPGGGECEPPGPRCFALGWQRVGWAAEAGCGRQGAGGPRGGLPQIPAPKSQDFGVRAPTRGGVLGTGAHRAAGSQALGLALP